MKAIRAALALAFPIAVLLGVAIHKQHRLTTGERIRFPISGLDPRDLLSGHYLTYRIDYGISELCSLRSAEGDGFLCLDPRMFFYDQAPAAATCERFIRGTCRLGRFEAGIDRFYVPEESALKLEKLIREKPGEIEISVSPTGQATVADLWIDGKNWRSY